MKFLGTLLTLALLITNNAFAATAQVNNIFQLGGTINGSNPIATVPVTNVNRAITLSGGTNSTTASNYIVLIKNNSNATTGVQYQVPTGYTTQCFGFYAAVGSTAQRFVQFGYGTAALAAGDTGTPPTGAVSYGMSGGAPGISTFAAAASTYYYFPFMIAFPSASYPFVRYHTSSEVFFTNLSCVEILN